MVEILAIAVVACGCTGYVMAKQKGLDGASWFLGCAVFGVFGLFFLACQPSADSAAAHGWHGAGKAYDVQKWAALLDLDAEIAAAAAHVRADGEIYVDRLAERYLTVNDKSYLSQIVERVVAEAEADRRQQRETEAASFAGARTRTYGGQSYQVAQSGACRLLWKDTGAWVYFDTEAKVRAAVEAMT